MNGKGFTKIPNEIIEAMPEMTPAQVALCVALCRLTYGWHRPAATASVSELARMTGLARPSIYGLMDGLGRFFIRDGKTWSIKSVTLDDTLPLAGDKSVTLDDSQVSPEITLLHLPKEKKEKNKERSNGIGKLFEVFKEASGHDWPHESTMQYQDYWLRPLESIYGHFGQNLAEAERVIREAVNLQRSGNLGKRYPVNSPKSIIKVALDIPPASASRAESDWQTIKEAAAAGDVSQIPDRLTHVVRQIGWGELQSMTDRTERQYQQRFMEAYA
jgi:hypothetical protein